ncbi:programmed cell death 1 ligand 1-like isoform X1 [Scomber scombrus]|uniref:Programmed cell death 1 ligand 1-like isoform X1 n=1 Tax=Scomber scombrus TaxID=13677 RepID=A0AAV1Q832_SCOSC
MATISSHGDVILWIFLVYSLNSGSCQTKVQAYIKDDVLLPCIYNSTPPASFSIYWRDKSNNKVLDIINNVEQQTQDENFKDRVRSFPDQYMKGNFSIILRDVKQDDAGGYECNIRIGYGSKHRVRLNVTGERPKAATTPSKPAGGAAAVTPTSIQLLLLSLLLIHSAGLSCCSIC